eukprot:snap_masked-scaffold_54-processed-gene-0.27-mRNA-1 protein AED:1.00 eAED:1.00 QI:0/-1/0/0/-1/1/1/0/455
MTNQINVKELLKKNQEKKDNANKNSILRKLMKAAPIFLVFTGVGFYFTEKGQKLAQKLPRVTLSLDKISYFNVFLLYKVASLVPGVYKKRFEKLNKSKLAESFEFFSLNERSAAEMKSFNAVKATSLNPTTRMIELENEAKKRLDAESELEEEIKALEDSFEKVAKQAKTITDLESFIQPRVFIIEFFPCRIKRVHENYLVNDHSSAALDKFSQAVSFLIDICRPYDQVYALIESPGGGVSIYGFLYAELSRLKAKGIQVTAFVDKVGASGGYLLACAAGKIVASPFAYVGSIGVIAPDLNISKAAKKILVDFNFYAAGESKAPLHPLVPIEEKKEKSLLQRLGFIHNQFKDVLQTDRGLSKEQVSQVATGEVWLAKHALDKELGLVDEIGTSAEYIQEAANKAEVILVRRKGRKIWKNSIAKYLFGDVQDKAAALLSVAHYPEPRMEYVGYSSD